MDNYRVSKRALAALFTIIFVIIFAIFPLTNANAANAPIIGGKLRYIVDDLDNYLTDDEELELKYALIDACLSADCNIVIVITSDLGGKTSKQFADDYGDKWFGAGNDTVVLLLFNSYNKPEYADATDYISTSGKMRNKLDKYIDAMFDSIYDKMGEPKGDPYAFNESTGTYGGYDYLSACKAFASGITLYAGGFSLDEDVDPGFSSGGGTTLVETKGFAELLSELVRGIFRMLGGLRFGY